MILLHSETVDGKLYKLYDVIDEDRYYPANYLVLIKVPMNNFPGCCLFFEQEVYRSQRKTSRLKKYFPSYTEKEWENI